MQVRDDHFSVNFNVSFTTNYSQPQIKCPSIKMKRQLSIHRQTQLQTSSHYPVILYIFNEYITVEKGPCDKYVL